MWINQHIELGILKVGDKKEIEFKLKYPYPLGFEINNMRSSCGCSTPVELPGGAGVKVSYVAKPVPKHLYHKGEYTTTKKITVDTSEGKFDLTFRVTVKN